MEKVIQAMNILRYNAKAPAARLEKLLQSAIANWEAKTGDKIDEGTVCVKMVQVDSARYVEASSSGPAGSRLPCTQTFEPRPLSWTAWLRRRQR